VGRCLAYEIHGLNSGFRSINCCLLLAEDSELGTAWHREHRGDTATARLAKPIRQTSYLRPANNSGVEKACFWRGNAGRMAL